VNEIYILLGALLLVSAFDLVVVAARSSFLQISNARLLALGDQMEAEVDKTMALLTTLPRLRASLKLTLVLTRFATAGLILGIVLALPATSAFLMAGVVFIGALLVFWFEWAVERAVGRSPEIWAVRLTEFLRLLTVVATVFLFPISISKESQEANELPNIVTEEELRTLIDAGEVEGIFEHEERRMIHSIFQLGETLVREIMVPRIDMLALDMTTSLSDAADTLIQSGFSRLPVFEDNVDNMLGLLYAKDLLRVWREGDKLGTLKEIIRDAYFVPEAKKVDELLTEMQTQRIHMAIIVDEYGGVAGLVTLEDIVEEILGEILDEYDQGEEAPYQQLDDSSYVFLGRVDLDDFNDIMGSDLPSDEADTLGGYIYSQLGRVPTVGEVVEKENLLLTVEQVSARRIRKVSARWLQSDSVAGEAYRHDNR